MAAVVLGGVMAAQPLTGRSLAQHTYMFAGEVLRSFPYAEYWQLSGQNPMTQVHWSV